MPTPACSGLGTPDPFKIPMNFKKYGLMVNKLYKIQVNIWVNNNDKKTLGLQILIALQCHTFGTEQKLSVERNTMKILLLF